MNYLNGALITLEKHSGINTIKPYSELLAKAFSLNWSEDRGSLYKTNQILIEYLHTLEGLDLGSPNYDFHIDYSIKIEKTDLLPLFIKSDLSADKTSMKEFQFINLNLKIIFQLFMNFSEKILLFPAPDFYKKIISYERVYIESMFKFIKKLCQNNSSGKDTEILKKYQFSYDTLVSGFSSFSEELPFIENINTIINKIEIRNNELHSLATKIAEKRSSR